MNNNREIIEKLYEPLCIKIALNNWTQFDSNFDKVYKNLSLLFGNIVYFKTDIRSEKWCGVLAKFIKGFTIIFWYCSLIYGIY
jgi:hypothetical protein